MKKFFAIVLAVTVIVVSLPLALLTSASQPDFDEIFANYENVASKTYFDTKTSINTEGYVADYNNVVVEWRGLSSRETNHLSVVQSANINPYVTIEVDDINAIETGLVIHKGQLNATSLTFYTSSDMQNWTEVADSKIAVSQELCTTSTNNSTDYYLRRERFAELPAGTKYVKVAITTAAAWQPGLDYIDVFKPDNFKTALDGYESVPIQTYFDTNTPIDTEGYVADYNNVVVEGRGLATRQGNHLSVIQSANINPYVTIEVDDNNAIETGLVVHKGQLAATSLAFYTSSDMQSWTRVEDDKISVSQELCTTTSNNSTDYYLRRERFSQLPKDTKYVKIAISTAAAWQPGLDYIDVYKPDRFDDVLDGYENTAYATYFDTNTPINTEGYVAGYNNVEVKGRGVGGRDANGQVLSLINGQMNDPYVIIPIDKDNAVELAFLIETQYSANGSLGFATTANTNLDEAVWTEVGKENIFSVEYTSAESPYTIISNYSLRKQRIVDLPQDTAYLKVSIKAGGWWYAMIDYIDVYQLDYFDTALDGYEAKPVKTYFDTNAAIDTKNYVEAYKNVKVYAQGLGIRDGNYLKFEALGDNYVVIKVDEDNVIETGLSVEKKYSNSSYLSFYISADNKTWEKLSKKLIARNEQEAEGKPTHYLRKERLYDLPDNTKYVKIVINSNVIWQPGLDYIDVYEKDGAAEQRIKTFNGLTDGYSVVKSLLSEQETLNSTSILSYKNWNWIRDGLPYRDAFSTQRPNSDNSDAEIIITVSDDTLTEVGTVISEGLLSNCSNTYYASADGKKWTKLDETQVYVKEIKASAKKPDGYTGLKAGFVARIERIVRLPKGTAQLKIVNSSSTWWQPGIEYIDLYEPVTEVKLSGYELDTELITNNSKLDNKNIVSYSNWKYIDNGVKLEDAYSLARQNTEKSEIVVKASKNTPVSIGYTVPAGGYGKLKNTYYTSTDGKKWTKLSADKVITRKITSLTEINLTKAYCGRIDLIIGLEDSVKYVKAVTDFDNSQLSSDVQINFIKLYKVYINPFDTVIDGYRVVETLLTPTNTIEAQSIISYKNWRFGKMGLPFFDEVGTQRYADKSEDAYIIVSVDDATAVEVATVIAKSLEGCTSNTYYASADGKKWTKVSAENIYSKRFVTASDNLLTESTIGLMERVVGLPKGTTQLKIVTSTQNKLHSWWQPSINRITLYKDPFDIAVDGRVVVDNALTPSDKLSSERIVSAKNWKYANTLAYKNKGGAVRKNSADAQMVLSVVDTMTVEIATVASKEVHPHTYYISTDGKKWTKLSSENIHSRVFSNTEKLSGKNKATVERISDLPEGTIYLKLVSSGNVDYAVNYITFYDKAVDSFDLAFVGYGCTDSLFNSTRKLNDSLVISYENWHYGTNGYSFTDNYSLQRDKDNCKDASLVLSVKDDQALEVGTIISNSWLKKTKTIYYTSTDGNKWTKLSDSSVLKRYYTTAQDSRVKEGYNVLVERVTNLPVGTAFVKFIVSTGNEINSWWQPGIDYVDIYSPYEELSLEQIAAQAGEKEATIQFTNDKDGLKNGYIFSSKNLVNGKYGLKYTDEYSTRRVGYNDSEIILSVNEDTIIELGTLIDKSLEYCAENKFYTSIDGELWTPFDAGMLLNARVDKGVTANTFARVQMLSELPSDTKYVKIVGTTNGVTDAWKNFGIDYITIYKGASDFKIKNPLESPQIMIVGNFMTIMLEKNQKFTIDDLTDRLDSGKLLIYYYTAADVEICDGMTDVENGQKLVLKRNNKSKKEYIISLSYIENKPLDANVGSDGVNIPLIIGLSAAGVVVVVGAVLLILYIKRKKVRA